MEDQLIPLRRSNSSSRLEGRIPEGKKEVSHGLFLNCKLREGKKGRGEGKRWPYFGNFRFSREVRIRGGKKDFGEGEEKAETGNAPEAEDSEIVGRALRGEKEFCDEGGKGGEKRESASARDSQLFCRRRFRTKKRRKAAARGGGGAHALPASLTKGTTP